MLPGEAIDLIISQNVDSFQNLKNFRLIENTCLIWREPLGGAEILLVMSIRIRVINGES